MDTSVMIEIFGYIGSGLVVVSMLMPSIVKLRVINTVGSVISAIYAVICGAFPLVLMNLCLIAINVYNLIKLLRTKQVYDLVYGSGDDAFVKYFLARYAEDVKLYFPGFEQSGAYGTQAYLVCCDGNPAGVLLGKEDHGVFDIIVDYSAPAYRDCSVGAYLYSKLTGGKIHTLRFGQNISEAHASYLHKMNFVQEGGVYVKRFSNAL